MLLVGDAGSLGGRRLSVRLLLVLEWLWFTSEDGEIVLDALCFLLPENDEDLGVEQSRFVIHLVTFADDGTIVWDFLAILLGLSKVEGV